MDKDKKTWLIAFLVLVVVVLVLSNFGVITGQVPRANIEKLSKVYLSTSEDIVDVPSLSVKSGSLVYVTIETGSEGIWNRVSFYRGIEGVRKREAMLTLTTTGCGGNYCDQNKVVSGSYKIGSDWDGTYCVSVKDRAVNKEVEKCFEVKA